MVEKAQHRAPQRRWRAWKKAGASKQVCRWIRDGLPLPFAIKPSGWQKTPPAPPTPVAAAGRAAQWRTMVADGTLSYFKAPDQRHSFVASSREEPKFTDGVANGKFRLITDFRPLNACLQDRTVKMETLKHLPALTQPTSVTTSLDFKAFFYSFAVHPQYRKFVVTRAPAEPHPATVGLNAANHPIDASGNLTYVPSALYSYNALPMGLSLSPFFVIKITKFLLAWVRSFRPDTNCLAFIDDWLLIASPADIYDLDKAFRLLVSNLGLVIAPAKGWTAPLDRFVFLGLGVCLHSRSFYVPTYKVEKLALRCNLTLKHSATHLQRVPARAVASLAGLATSLMLASPAIPLFTRSLHRCLTGVTRWNSTVVLPNQAIQDIKALATLGSLFQSAPFQRSRTTSTLYTDASTRAYGAWGGTPDGPLTDMSGYWDTSHTCGEINVLELRAVLLALRANRHQLCGQHIPLRSDNSCVIAVVAKHASRSEAVMATYRELYAFLVQNRMQLTGIHIGTKINVHADDLSRANDGTEFRYSRALRLRAQAALHLVCTSDRFASRESNQTNLPFDSRWACETAAHINTFHTRWHDRPWLTPPLALLMACLLKVDQDGCSALLVAPMWPAAPWWPLPPRLQHGSLHFEAAAEVRVHANNQAQPEILRNRKWRWNVWLVVGSTA